MAAAYAGAISMVGPQLTIDHSLIIDNVAAVGGAFAIGDYPCNLSLDFCTVTGNSDGHGVGGMWVFGTYGRAGVNSPTIITITNSIMRNQGYEFINNLAVQDHLNTYNFSYSDIEDGAGGEQAILETAAYTLNLGIGNFDADPLFVDADNSDYNLTGDSPCIDAADPDADNDPDETRADMGVYYFGHEPGPRVRYVPDVYASIQGAIDAASNDDEIQVSAGTYNENILFDAKSVTVTGDPENPENVIIDAGGNERVVTFAFGESDGAVLRGFTLQNGVTGNNFGGTFGGGIYFGGSS